MTQDETLLQFVNHEDVEKMRAEGWRVVSHLGHHTKYAVLMEACSEREDHHG